MFDSLSLPQNQARISSHDTENRAFAGAGGHIPLTSAMDQGRNSPMKFLWVCLFSGFAAALGE
jgi:hypothetical protein